MIVVFLGYELHHHHHILNNQLKPNLLITHSFTMITIMLALLFSPIFLSFLIPYLFLYPFTYVLQQTYYYNYSSSSFPSLRIFTLQRRRFAITDIKLSLFQLQILLLLFDLTVRLLLLAFLFSKLHIKEKPRRKKQSNI